MDQQKNREFRGTKHTRMPKRNRKKGVGGCFFAAFSYSEKSSREQGGPSINIQFPGWEWGGETLGLRISNLAIPTYEIEK